MFSEKNQLLGGLAEGGKRHRPEDARLRVRTLLLAAAALHADRPQVHDHLVVPGLQVGRQVAGLGRPDLFT